MLNANAREIRACALSLLFHAGSGHPGGVLSSTEILEVLWRRAQPWADTPQGRIVLSKGHSVATLYALAGLSGMLADDEGISLRKLNSRLQGHPDVASLPWLETSTGSLGQGFSFSVGLALGLRHQANSAAVYAVLGDGELQEGQVWEAAMSAAHFGLNRLTAVVDYNKLQSDARNSEIMEIEPLEAKWSAFGWHVQEVDGHSTPALAAALDAAESASSSPSVIIAHTVKGKGVSFMEDVPAWHGSVRMTEDQVSAAWDDLGIPKTEQNDLLAGRLWGGE